MNGRGAEDLMTMCCRRLEVDRRAWIRRAHPETGVDRDGRRYFKHAGLPDFIGALRSGRLVVFDVKSTRTGRFAWPDRPHSARTKWRQVQDLVAAGSDFGALAGLLVVFWATSTAVRDRMFWVPYAALDRVVNRSWSPDALAGAAVEVPWPASDDPDFLGAALAWEAQAA